MAVNNQNPFQKQYVDSFQGKNVDEEELLNLPNETYFEVISQYNIDDNGNLTSKVSSGVYVPNNPAPEDRSLVEKPDPNPIIIPADQTVNIGDEVAAGNMVVGGDTSVDPSTGLMRIEIQPRYTDEDRGTTGKGVSPDAPEENFYDNDDVESGGIPGGVGAGSDGSDTGAPPGLNKDSKSVTEINKSKDAAGINGSKPVFDADLSKIEINPRPNELNVFSSVTYNIGLYMINSSSYVNLMTAPSTPEAVLQDSILLMRSGGVGAANSDNAIAASLGIDNNFFIDDLEVTTISAGPSKFKQNTNATDIRFTITEPRGVTLLEKLQTAAKITLAKTKEQYIHAPYLLEIKFKGYDETGQPIVAPSKAKYIPIKITDISFEITGAGTVYTVTAMPYAHKLFGQINSTIPMNIELTAGTIGNIFSDQIKSFTVQPEERVTTENERAEEITTTIPEKLKYGDSYKTLGDALTDYQKDRTKETVKVSTERQGPNGPSGGFTEEKIPAAAEMYDTYSFTIATEIANAKLNVDAIFDALDSPTPTGQKKDDGKANKSQFEAYASGFKGSVSIDKDKKTFKINAGTDITKLLNLVIMHSDYMDKNVIENPEQAATSGQPINWFKVKPIIKSATGAGKGFDNKDGRYKYHIEYVVEPSVIYYHDFPWAKKSKPSGNGVHKVYDYIFSGKNTEVLSFDLKFRNAFMQTMTAGTGSPFANKNADNPFLPQVKEQPQSIEGNTANGKDSLNRARAKDLFSTVMSDGVDMVELSLGIVGDPAYFTTSDFYWQDRVRQGRQYTEAFMPDGTINYELSQPYVQVNLKTPVDYDDITGLANPNVATNSSFSGVYKVTEITNNFSAGIFQQTLRGIRAPLQPDETGVSRSKEDNAGKERNAVKDDIEKAENSTEGNTGNPDKKSNGLTNQQATVVNPFEENRNIDYGETPPYTSATVNNARTAEIARGPDQSVQTIPDVNADLSSSWTPATQALQNAPSTFTPTPSPVRVITPEALEDQSVDTL